jgi:hypothetical protein
MNTKELRRLANEVGCIKWTHDTRWNRETVWHLDGDEVCKCATNIGHMPEPVFAGDVAAFIAAANPAAIIELLDKFDATNAEIARLRDLGSIAFNRADNRDADLEEANMRTAYMQAERDCANSEVADLKQEVEEHCALIDKLSSLLAGVATALKGEPEAMTRHSCHDVVELTQIKVLALEAAEVEIAALKSAMRKALDEMKLANRTMLSEAGMGIIDAVLIEQFGALINEATSANDAILSTKGAESAPVKESIPTIKQSLTVEATIRPFLTVQEEGK